MGNPKHFLDVADCSPAEIQDMLDLAIRLKKEHFAGGNQPLFKSEGIHFGLVDGALILGFLAAFMGLIFLLAR